MRASQVNRKKRAKPCRLSVTLSGEHHSVLQRLAQDRKVSLAWVVRDAIEKYVAAEEAVPDGHG